MGASYPCTGTSLRPYSLLRPLVGSVVRVGSETGPRLASFRPHTVPVRTRFRESRSTCCSVPAPAPLGVRLGRRVLRGLTMS